MSFGQVLDVSDFNFEQADLRISDDSDRKRLAQQDRHFTNAIGGEEEKAGVRLGDDASLAAQDEVESVGGRFGRSQQLFACAALQGGGAAEEQDPVGQCAAHFQGEQLDGKQLGGAQGQLGVCFLLGPQGRDHVVGLGGH